MKNILHIWLFLFTGFVYGQRIDNGDIVIKMELSPVIEVFQISKSNIRIANTDNIIINYCDKYFELTPGVRIVEVDLSDECTITIQLSKYYNLESIAHSRKIIYNGIKMVDYISNQIIKSEDYVEYEILNGLVK